MRGAGFHVTKGQDSPKENLPVQFEALAGGQFHARKAMLAVQAVKPNLSFQRTAFGNRFNPTLLSYETVSPQP